jgi:TPR repeat protein
MVMSPHAPGFRKSAYFLVALLMSVSPVMAGMSPAEVRAFEDCMVKAAKGDRFSQCQLGDFYSTGQGVQANQEVATKWYRQAAEQGLPLAQHKLGNRHAFGHGAPKDLVESATWHRMAAEQGFDWSQYHLANCYLLGDGVKKDVDEALKWFRAAAEQGDSAYQYQLALSLHQGRLAFRDGKQDMPEVFKWYRAAAVQGEIDALRALSHLYGQGGDVEKDDAEALKWLRMAAGWGDESSQGLLGDRYASGTGVAKDEVEAFAYYRLASVYPSNPTQKNGRAGESLAALESKMSADARERGVRRADILKSEIAARVKARETERDARNATKLSGR